MVAASYSRSLTIGGQGITKVVVRTGDHVNNYGPVTIAAGKAVTNWVKTDANTAACDLTAGHGQTNGKYDVFWSESGVAKKRYNVDGTISTNALSLDGGSGDDFPASATTGIVVCKPTTVSTYIDGDTCEIIGVVLESTTEGSTAKGHVLFQDSGGAEVEAMHLTANDPRIADVDGGDTNFVTGNVITAAKVSNGSSSETMTFTLLSLEDSTP